MKEGPYSKAQLSEIEKVRAVFSDYIRTSPCMDLVWSDKAGYLYLTLELTAGCPSGLGSAPAFIQNAEMLCDRLFMEIVCDVTNSSGKSHAAYEADEQERAEVEKRLRPYLRQLPEYAHLTEQLYTMPLYLQRELERSGPANSRKAANMVRTTLKTISKKPFPQNYLEEILGTEIDQSEVPPDFAAGLQPVLAECMANGLRAEKIVRLRYESGFTYTQIAKEIGVQQERIRYIIRDSQRRLRRARYRSFLKEGYAAWQNKAGGKRAGPPNI